MSIRRLALGRTSFFKRDSVDNFVERPGPNVNTL
jgi:hypothetical protein